MEPWVVMVVVINHATEHREQISSMLSALGVTPPNLDGWSYGEVTKWCFSLSLVGIGGGLVELGPRRPDWRGQHAR